MILVDTGPLVAAAVRNDPRHDACTKLLLQRAGELVVPGPVVAETCHMLEYDDERSGSFDPIRLCPRTRPSCWAW